MNNQLPTPSINFNFDDHPVRTILRNDDPWFFASDICSAIGLDSTAIRKLDDDEKGLHLTQTLGGMQEVAIISESGLYTIILRCRDAIKLGTVPYRFRKWVTSEVLPQIRKTGSYSVSSHPAEVHAFCDDYANRTEIIYYQDFKPVFCRTLSSREFVFTPEGMMEWLEMRGMVFFTREELEKITAVQLLATLGR